MRPTQFISVLSATAVVAATPIDKRASSSFSLYAYGTGLSGLRLFTSGDQAYVGDYSLFNDDQAAPVIFTQKTGGSLLGNPDTSVSATASWSNLTYYVASPTSSNHTVGFIRPTDDPSSLVTEFIFYGAWIATRGKSGVLETLWYVTPTDTNGIYSLKWNSTSDSTDEQISISLKKTAPSS